jgi:preprotein translocase subunit SecG
MKPVSAIVDGLALSAAGLLLLTQVDAAGALIVLVLAAATAAAGQLPAGSASEMLDAAREAFTSGLNVVAAIGAVVFVAFAILAATALRDKGATGETADAHDTAGRADADASESHPEGVRA